MLYVNLNIYIFIASFLTLKVDNATDLQKEKHQ